MPNNPPEERVPRQFIRELRNGDIEKASFYLADMIGTHLDRYPYSADMLTIFISAHVIMSLDISGSFEMLDGVPIEPIIQAEVHHFMTEYRGEADATMTLSSRIMERVAAFGRANPFQEGGPRLNNVPEDDRHHDMVKAVCNYLEAHFQDPKISVTHTAEHFEVSVSYMSRMFHEATGIKMGDYILLLRFDEAKRLLRTSDLSVAEIAMRCGFSSCSAFIRSFRAKEDTTPGAYRRRLESV